MSCVGIWCSTLRTPREHWQQKFDCKEHQEKLNAELPQYTLDINVNGFDTLNIHFVHQPSILKHADPLLFVHGCKSIHKARGG